jgi:DNA-binding transcriptional regulator YbjK
MIGDAALEVLAANGSRGLTHRSVDRWLGWPEGTTSRYHRTRDSLMNAAVRRLVEVEVVHLEQWERDQTHQPTTTTSDVAAILAKTYQEWIHGDVRQIARYEMSLEARRQARVHQAIISGRKSLNKSIERLLMACGCDAPKVHATSVVSLLDGMVHDQLLHPEIATPPAEVEDIFRRWLQSC